MRVLIAAIVALVLAGTVGADNVPIDAPAQTRSGATGHEGMFFHVEGDHLEDLVYGTANAGTVDIAIDPTGIPGWLHISIPEEATLEEVRFVFWEPVSTPDLTGDLTYASGDTCEFYIGASRYEGWFKIAGWDRVEMWLIGSGYGLVDVYWYVEKYTDSE